MSFDDGEIAGSFTELEISAGIPGLLSANGGYEDGDELYEGEDFPESEEIENSSLLSISLDRLSERQIMRYEKAIAVDEGSVVLEELKAGVIQHILKDNICLITHLYAIREGLGDAHISLLKRSDCIHILMKGILGKVAKIPLSSNLVDRVASVAEKAVNPIEVVTPYERVGWIQRFIWNEVDQVYGARAAKKLPVRHMRDLLSAARLYISLDDVKNKSPIYLREVMKLCCKEAEQEESFAENMPEMSYFTYLSNKKTFPKWRVRHMRPISYHAHAAARCAISDIESVKTFDRSGRDKIIFSYVFLDLN